MRYLPGRSTVAMMPLASPGPLCAQSPAATISPGGKSLPYKRVSTPSLPAGISVILAISQPQK
ncbi:MAG: hypothetical protein V9H25_17040 [Candidatus Competibacter sp.]